MSKDPDSKHRHVRQRFHKATLRQIGAVLEQIVKVNQHKRYKRVQRELRLGNLELPLCFFYRVTLEYCSCLLNGVPCSVLPPNNDDTGTLFTANDSHTTAEVVNEDLRNDHSTTLMPVVDHLFAFLEEHIDHNGLQLFADLHVTWGLLHIAKMLPVPCVELLSQSFDRDICRTPFEQMSRILLYLEDSQCLTDNRSTSADKSVINVGELEFTLHRAAAIFARCVERAPTDVSCHAWYVATLASSLLLCSGNRIGSAALTDPSPQFTNVDSRRYNVKAEKRDTCLIFCHVRRMLPKFQELRCETAKAFGLLLHLAKCQQGMRASLAVASFLEWRQVFALLVGPDDSNGDAFDSICQLHLHYSKHWALEEQSKASFLSIPVRDNSESNEILDVLSRALEANPSDIGNWRSLAYALGPIGTATTAQEASACSASKCQSCSRLSHNRSIHSVASHIRREQAFWWGAERSEWWYESLLQQDNAKRTKVGIIKVTGEDANTTGMKLVEALEETQSVPFLPPNLMIGQVFDHQEHTRWLDDLLRSPFVTLKKEPSEKVKVSSQAVDDFLPVSFSERRDRINEQSDSPYRLTLSDNGSIEWELWTYKVMILCHLSTPLHLGVDIGVERLVKDAWDGSNAKVLTNRDSFLCLRWLYRMGLNVIAVFLQSHLKVHDHDP